MLQWLPDYGGLVSVRGDTHRGMGETHRGWARRLLFSDHHIASRRFFGRPNSSRQYELIVHIRSEALIRAMHDCYVHVPNPYRVDTQRESVGLTGPYSHDREAVRCARFPLRIAALADQPPRERTSQARTEDSHSTLTASAAFPGRSAGAEAAADPVREPGSRALQRCPSLRRRVKPGRNPISAESRNLC